MVDHLPSSPTTKSGTSNATSSRSRARSTIVDTSESRYTGGTTHYAASTQQRPNASSDYLFEAPASVAAAAAINTQELERKFELIKEYMALYRDFRRQYDFNQRMQHQLHEHFRRRQQAGQKAAGVQQQTATASNSGAGSGSGTSGGGGGESSSVRPQSSVAGNSDSAKNSAKSSSKDDGSQAGDASSTDGGGGIKGGKIPAAVMPQREAKQRQEQEEEQRYRKHLFACEDAKQALEVEKRTADGEFKQTQNDVARLRATVDDTEVQLHGSKERAAKAAVYTRSGKPLPSDAVESLFGKDKYKTQELNLLQHLYIRLQLKKTKLEDCLRKLEQVASGLTLNKFEEMRAEARSFSDRLESRTEELNVLRRRRINTVQIISHVKEKLHYERRKLLSLESDLHEIDSHFNSVRDELTVEKQQRDKARLKKSRVWMDAGLLTNATLLRDLDEKVKRRDELTDSVKSAALNYRGLIADVEKLYQKITSSGFGVNNAVEFDLIQQAVRAR